MTAPAPRHRLTGSRTALGALCLYWARPDVEPGAEADTAGRRIGSAFHELAEKHPEASLDDVAQRHELRPAEADTVTELYEAWRAWWPGYVLEAARQGSGGVSIRREVALAWDTATWTARELPTPGGHRDYTGALPSEVPCTLDVVLQGDAGGDLYGPEYGELEVIDLKTAYDPGRADGHAQLAACGLAAARAWGYASVRVTIARVRPEGVTTDSAVLSAFDLDEIAARLEQLVAAIPGAEPHPGEHCRWCPAAAVCPATRALVAAAREERPELAGLFLAPIRTHAQAARLKLALKPMEAFLADLRARVAAFADEHGGIRMPDGTVQRRVDQPTRKIDASNERLLATLRAALGEDGFRRVLKTRPTIPIAAVEREASATAPRGRKKDAARELLADLQSTGGVRLSVRRRWESDEGDEE